ncbi:FadR/GntR family transcriptional regulator [Prauserella cavernicola]|uniref:FadR family transcriptional regulator n=1 Tax=Prauserella cavernicola TaxID=2800127 RepID=A0A934V803_9PSEU|nr:GntR family transcriptional regulator [Prauserella cavernicola]MBK1789147.1 FadR family transcriptional regulator [Prauserella cavernicola]
MEDRVVEFSEVTKRSAYESIVAQIEQAIDERKFQVGDRLPSERRLMEQFGVSRPTVREAMRVLQATGVLSSGAGDPRGPQVLGYSPVVLRKSLGRLARTGSTSRVELLQFRLSLESTGCLLAAHNRTDQDLADMRTARTAILGIAQPGSEAGRIIEAYQATIRRASGNQLIEITGAVLAGVIGELVDQRLESAPQDRAERIRVADHYAGQVLQAIEVKDGARAAHAVRTGIVAYYDDDLSAEERAAIAPVLTA